MSEVDPRLLAAIEAADVQAWSWDVHTSRVYWSPGLERMFGMEPGAFAGTFEAYLAVIAPDDRAMVTASIQRAIAEGSMHDIDHRVILKSGEVRWVTCRGNVVRGADGEPTGMAGVVWDVTGRHHAEERLRASEERFRALVENGTDCISLLREDGVISYASPAVSRLLGLPLAEIIGTKAIDYVHPDDKPIALQTRAAPDGDAVPSAFRVRHASGEWRWLSGTATNLLHDPVVGAMVSNRRDVTEERAALDQLRFQGAILDQVNEAVIASDLQATIIYWNRAAERLYGWTAAEAIGRPGGEVLSHEWPNPADVEGHAHALRTTGHWRGMMRHKTKDGVSLDVEASIRVLCDEAGKPIAGINVMQDVTARRRLEDQLRQSQKMDAIGVLAGGVAHDFNNLLAVILGFAELPLRRLPPQHPDAVALREVVAAAERGAELTRKLLTFSRQRIIQRAPIDLSDAIGEIAKLLTRIVGEDVEIVVRRAKTPLVVHADPVQIEQVVFNLCTNARQAMPRGGKLAIDVRKVDVDDAYLARASWARAGSFAELSVTDTGVGMDEATLARIFEPFFTTKDRGTGLGLATVYGIVEQHGGRLHAESTPGVGTTLRVHFPLDPSASVRAPPTVHESLVPGGTETILIAEDAAPLRALLSATLGDLGYKVITAEDGEEAVRAFEANARDIALVVLDVIMPKLGALEAYERMRLIQPEVKALFTTGYAPEATRLVELLDGAPVRVLEKPFSSRMLGLSVRRAIDA